MESPPPPSLINPNGPLLIKQITHNAFEITMSAIAIYMVAADRYFTLHSFSTKTFCAALTLALHLFKRIVKVIIVDDCNVISDVHEAA